MSEISTKSPRRLPGASRAAAFREPDPASFAPPVTTQQPQPAAIAVREPDVISTWSPPPPVELPAEWGRRRTVIKVLSLGLAKPRPGREELDHRHNVRTIRQATWTRSVRIAVANPKGGAGKTPVAVVLGGVLASVRGGSVAVWDASDAAGTLAARTEGVAARCISEIATDPEPYGLPSTIAMVAATQSSFADVLGSLREREFDADSVHNVSGVLDRTYRISVADTGNVPHSPAFEAVIEQADILVVPTILTADSVNKAIALLQRLQDSPSGLVQRALVAVLHNRGPETPGLAPHVQDIFATAGVGAVIDIPFDPHIAAGTAITLANLSHASQLAWTRLAAATVSNIVAV